MFLHQTDLGEGATRQVSAVEWMQAERLLYFVHNQQKLNVHLQ